MGVIGAAIRALATLVFGGRANRFAIHGQCPSVFRGCCLPGPRQGWPSRRRLAEVEYPLHLKGRLLAAPVDSFRSSSNDIFY